MTSFIKSQGCAREGREEGTLSLVRLILARMSFPRSKMIRSVQIMIAEYAIDNILSLVALCKTLDLSLFAKLSK